MRRAILLALLSIGCATVPAGDGSVRLQGDAVVVRLTKLQRKAYEARDREHHGVANFTVSLTEPQRASLREALGEEALRPRVQVRLRSGAAVKCGDELCIELPRGALGPPGISHEE